jgi:hypothetical protein
MRLINVFQFHFNIILPFSPKRYSSLRFTEMLQFLNLGADFWDDRLCGLVISIPGYRSRGPGWIAGATKLSDK